MTLPVHFSNIRSSTPTAFTNNKICPKQTSEVTETEVATDGKIIIIIKSADDWPHIGD